MNIIILLIIRQYSNRTWKDFQFLTHLKIILLKSYPRVKYFFKWYQECKIHNWQNTYLIEYKQVLVLYQKDIVPTGLSSMYRLCFNLWCVQFADTSTKYLPPSHLQSITSFLQTSLISAYMWRYTGVCWMWILQCLSPTQVVSYLFQNSCESTAPIKIKWWTLSMYLGSLGGQ